MGMDEDARLGKTCKVDSGGLESGGRIGNLRLHARCHNLMAWRSGSRAKLACMYIQPPPKGTPPSGTKRNECLQFAPTAKASVSNLNNLTRPSRSLP